MPQIARFDESGLRFRAYFIFDGNLMIRPATMNTPCPQ